MAVPHSMGTLYFMHFMKWVEAPLPMGGGGGPDWCAKHIKSVMNIAGPLLVVPRSWVKAYQRNRDVPNDFPRTYGTYR